MSLLLFSFLFCYELNYAFSPISELGKERKKAPLDSRLILFGHLVSRHDTHGSALLDWSRIFFFLFPISTTLYSVLGFGNFLWAFFWGIGAKAGKAKMLHERIGFFFGRIWFGLVGTGLGYDWKGFLK